MNLQLLPVFLVAVLGTGGAVPTWYTDLRNEFLSQEKRQSTGGNLTLTEAEEAANRILMAAKYAEIDDTVQNSEHYPPALHFFRARPIIDKSKVFQIIRKLPKGAALHLHVGSIVSTDWLVKNVTYRPHCYMCVAKNSIVATGFFLTPPANKECTWIETAKARAESADIDVFDNSIYKNFTFTVDNPELKYPHLNDIWDAYEEYYVRGEGWLGYRPVYEDYMYQAMKEFHEDNVQYIEPRYRDTQPYELDGTVHSHSELLQILRKVIERFKQDYPDFSGAKLIFATNKVSSLPETLERIKDAVEQFQKFPDLLLGFDLEEQEDRTPTILHFIDELLYPMTHGSSVPFYFHAGETDWKGLHDQNLIDAILLNTTRIGHGFAIPKHPEVMKIVKERSIGVEVSPISNQVLKLVADLRNHPASILLAQGFPICISSDIPSVWEALPLSHDFYMAFMALAGANDDLRFLKQLAINSINFSGMTPEEKALALQLWQTKWDKFISDVNTSTFVNEINDQKVAQV